MKSLPTRALLLVLLFIGALHSSALSAEPPALFCELHPGTLAAYGREYTYIVITNTSDRPLRLATSEVSPSRFPTKLPPAKHGDTYHSDYTFITQAQPPIFYGDGRDTTGQPFSIGLAKNRTAFEKRIWDSRNTFTLWPHARVTCYTTAITPRPTAATLHFLELVEGAFQPLSVELTAPK
jgi:hypothetical protein